MWSGTATHDVSTEGGSGPELLSDNDCDECSGCEEGNCDSLEGGGLGSLKFRIPLGVPRKGQICGFAWFLTKEPLTIGVDTLQVLSRADAQVSESFRRLIQSPGRPPPVSTMTLARPWGR